MLSKPLPKTLLEEQAASAYQKLQEAWQRAETLLLSMRCPRAVWVEQQGGVNVGALGIDKHADKWRLLVKPVGSNMALPLAETPLRIRMAAINLLSDLFEEVRKTMQGLIPSIETAADDINDICNDYVSK